MATTKKGQSKDPQAVKAYNQKYYAENKAKIADAKKEQYDKDPTIREKRKNAVAEFRRKRKERLGHRVEREYNGKTYAVTRVGRVLEETDVDYVVIQNLENAKILPLALFGKVRCYTDDQVAMVKDVIMTYKALGIQGMLEQGVKITMDQWLRSL